MARLSKLTKNEVPVDLQAAYEKMAALRGNVPNMLRVFAHRPEIAKTGFAHMEAITNTGTVPVRTKELVATLVSRLNRCEY